VTGVTNGSPAVATLAMTADGKVTTTTPAGAASYTDAQAQAATGVTNRNGGAITNLANTVPAGSATNLLGNIGDSGATVAIPLQNLPSGGSAFNNLITGAYTNVPVAGLTNIWFAVGGTNYFVTQSLSGSVTNFSFETNGAVTFGSIKLRGTGSGVTWDTNLFAPSLTVTAGETNLVLTAGLLVGTDANKAYASVPLGGGLGLYAGTLLASNASLSTLDWRNRTAVTTNTVAWKVPVATNSGITLYVLLTTNAFGN
jgi:hypothetical protein